MSGTVLITGGGEFVGTHLVLRLLDEGYRVRTTVRNAARGEELRRLLKGQGAHVDALEIVEADLTCDNGWSDAVCGCTAVMHVASPFPSTVPRDPSELIVPAREGTLRVLGAARDAGVDKVVLTSSFAAVGYTPKIMRGTRFMVQLICAAWGWWAVVHCRAIVG